jgi:hypothetical protein
MFEPGYQRRQTRKVHPGMLQREGNDFAHRAFTGQRPPFRAADSRDGSPLDSFARITPTVLRQPWSLVTVTAAAMLVSTLFLTRFALTVGTSELSLPLVVMAGGSAMLIVTGAVELSQARVLLFCAAMAAMLFATILGGSVRVSWLSYVNIVLVYLCYLGTAPDPREFNRIIALFRLFALIIAFAGIAQFFGQVVIKGPTLFTFAGLFPAQIISHGFNYVIPAPGLGGLNKSNGFFLVEPSSFSQLMALAIIVELEFFRPSWRLATLGLGLLLSFSGTGLLLFLAVVPIFIMRRGWGGLLLLGAPAAIFGAALLAGPKLQALLARIDEFGSQQSSGFARFLSPFYLIDQYLFADLNTAMFGMGPGAIEPYFKIAAYQIHDPTWGKLIFEYGLLGALPFAVFVGYCFFAGSRSLWLSTALFINYLILGGNLVDARLHVLIVALVVLHSRPVDLRRGRAVVPAADPAPLWPAAPAADNAARTGTRSPAQPRWP